MLEHGGNLRAAAQKFGIQSNDWLDLSTGINPNPWPVPTIPDNCWQRLPEEQDGLESAAVAYYQTDSLLPLAGSQAAIQQLPLLRARGTVGILHPTYSEHAHAWRTAGHECVAVTADRIEQQLHRLDVLLLCHPNNPDGTCFSIDALLHWQEQLARRGGWLIVDEAFIDANPSQSLAPFSPRTGLILLRSFGKFFGLAGARTGFVLAEDRLLQSLRERLGPWTITTASRWIARLALADHQWQATTRHQLIDQSNQLAALLSTVQLNPQGGCALFQWIRTPQAAALHQALAQQGILTRLFEDPVGLRFGLPKNKAQFARLESALEMALTTIPLTESTQT